jgi:hypothetical protein
MHNQLGTICARFQRFIALVAWYSFVLSLVVPVCCAEKFDLYGGTSSVHCRKGAQAHFYTEKIGGRWWLCDPAGNGFFLKGVYDIGPDVDSGQEALNTSKYEYGPTSTWQTNWALQQVRRLQAWGFNTIADYAYSGLWPVSTQNAWSSVSSDNTIALKLPFSVEEQSTHDAFQNVNGCGITSPMKDIMNGVGTAYSGYHYNFGDYFDPNFPTCVGNVLKKDTWGLQMARNAKYSNYLIYVTIDESDQTGFLDQGPDFATYDVANTGANKGAVSASAHASWITLVTAPVQISNHDQGVTYPDTRVYTKQELSNWLSTRYRGSIEALNAAWGSHYTTFGFSGGGWGRGSGILDENGTCPSKTFWQTCWIGDAYTLSGETAAMQSDMSAFYVRYLDQYFSVLTTEFHTYAPGILTQSQMGGWGSPPRREVLTEGAKYIDLPIMGTTPPWICRKCADVQARVDFTVRYLGDHPWINWVGFYALPDSAESKYATPNPAYPTQVERGTGYQAMVKAFANAKDTATGTYHVVGYDWWGMFDMDSQRANWGLCTPHDNPYDGKSATINGIDGKHGKDVWGYPTGGEAADYGNFVDYVAAANSRIYDSLAP